jgi:hypothetical protein
MRYVPAAIPGGSAIGQFELVQVSTSELELPVG